VAAVPSGPSWTPPPTKRIKKKLNYSVLFRVKSVSGTVSWAYLLMRTTKGMLRYF
jgi:hypothetical protein